MVRELSVYCFRGPRTSCGSCPGGIREHSSNGEGLTRDEELGAFGVQVALGIQDVQLCSDVPSQGTLPDSLA